MMLKLTRARTWGWIAAVCIGMLAVLASSARADPPPPPVTPVPWTDPSLRGKIDPTLLKQLATAKADEAFPIVVEMHAQADLSSAAARLPDRMAARARAIESLQATAESSQRGVRAFLAAEESAGRAGGVRPLWVINALSARAAMQTIQQLAARPDVALVRTDRWRQWINVESPKRDSRIKSLNALNSLYVPSSDLQPPASDFRPLAFASIPQSSVEWGVSKIRADQVWAAFNITGTGVVVANLDTGVDWLHPALNGNYRGCVKGVCQHDKSWYDGTGGGAVYPVDGHGHGTHTMGTMVGQDGIGVAPGARWIAARAFNSAGFGFDSWIHAGFQWMLAPGGDPAMAPDVLNNSWGNNWGGDTTFQNDVRALRAAGIFPVFSNGNSGPGAGTVGSPASLTESFAVGALDSSDMVASFSSRGPSPWGEIRPHVAAPGVNVRSAWPGGGYYALNGTSMAAPHVSGVVALMLSAQPGTAITTTAYVLTTTAVPLAATVPNNDSGWGRVDAYAAVMAVGHAGTLSGTVTDARIHAPIPGATVALSGTQHASTQTGSDGRYIVGAASGVYNVSAGAFGYETEVDFNVVISAGRPTVRDCSLTPLLTGTVQGAVTNAANGLPVTATVTALGTPVAGVAPGAYSLTLPVGTYMLRATALGYRVLTTTVTIMAGETITQDLTLTPGHKILLVDGGAWYSQSEIGYFQQALDELGYVYNTWPIRRLPDDTPHENDLAPYGVVIWSSPYYSPGYVGADHAITTFLTGTHSLLVSGQDVAYWDGGGDWIWRASYLADYLKTRYVRDDSGSRVLVGLDGDIMAGLAMSIAGSGGADNQLWPDEIAVSDTDSASQILAYQGDGAGGNKVGLCLPYRGVVLPFGYEAITDAVTRRAVMQRAMDYFASPPQAAGLWLRPTSAMVIARPGDTVTHTLRLRNISEVAGDTVTLTVLGATWPYALTPTVATVNSCDAVTVTLTVTVPSGTGWNTKDSVTLSAQSSLSPSVVATSVLTTKAPAPVLLVDDDCWYEVEGAYMQALTAAGISYDVWSVPQSGLWPLDGPPAGRLSWYPVVVWFTGYDWRYLLIITSGDETHLASFLDGGGRLFLSSPFYLDVMGLTRFARTRLGVASFSSNLTTSIAYGAADDPIGNELGVFQLGNPYFSAGFFTLGGSVTPGRGVATAWRGSSDRALAVHQAGTSSRTVFMITPFEAFANADAARAMGRIVGWLGWLGDSTLAADRGVAAAGDRVAFTLVARQNGSAPTGATLTATLPLSVTLVPESLSAEAGFDPATGVVTWTGTLAPGAAVTVTYQVTLDVALSAGTPLTTVAIFHDDTHDIPFDQSTVVHVAAPDFAWSAFAAPSPVRPVALLTYTLIVSHSGLAPAASAYFRVLLPPQAPVVSGSLTLLGPGAITVTPGVIGWQGSLDIGESVTLTYGLDTMGMLAGGGGTLLNEALLWDGAGGAWERAVWVDVVPYQAFLPMVLKR